LGEFVTCVGVMRICCADELQRAEVLLSICWHVKSSCCNLHPWSLSESLYPIRQHQVLADLATRPSTHLPAYITCGKVTLSDPAVYSRHHSASLVGLQGLDARPFVAGIHTMSRGLRTPHLARSAGKAYGTVMESSQLCFRALTCGFGTIDKS
jgi:hypothetical protein